LLIGFQDIAENVGDVFLGHSVIKFKAGILAPICKKCTTVSTHFSITHHSSKWTVLTSAALNTISGNYCM